MQPNDMLRELQLRLCLQQEPTLQREPASNIDCLLDLVPIGYYNCGVLRPSFHFTSVPSNPEDLLAKACWLYAELTRNYSRRKISNDSDAGNAVSGLLTRLQEPFFPQGQGFHYGIPVEVLRWALGWNGLEFRRRDQCPSWTWAGWEELLDFNTETALDELFTSPQPPLKVSRQGYTWYKSTADTLDVRVASFMPDMEGSKRILGKLSNIYKDLLGANGEKNALESLGSPPEDALLIEGILLYLKVDKTHGSPISYIFDPMVAFDNKIWPIKMLANGYNQSQEIFPAKASIFFCSPCASMNMIRTKCVPLSDCMDCYWNEEIKLLIGFALLLYFFASRK